MRDLRELEPLEPQFWRAPSAHNTQPWRLTYASDRVELDYDPQRTLPAGDPTQRDLLLSLGAFVETVLIVAERAGISLEFASDIRPGRDRVGVFTSSPASYESPFTPEDVARRQTSRLPYRHGRLTPDELADGAQPDLRGRRAARGRDARARRASRDGRPPPLRVAGRRRRAAGVAPVEPQASAVRSGRTELRLPRSHATRSICRCAPPASPRLSARARRRPPSFVQRIHEEAPRT